MSEIKINPAESNERGLKEAIKKEGGTTSDSLGRIIDWLDDLGGVSRELSKEKPFTDEELSALLKARNVLDRLSKIE